jgi:uncharacterized protein (DUF362 family)
MQPEMTSVPVALIDMKEFGTSSMREAARLLGGLKDINTSKREVLIKLGVFHHGFPQHTTVDVTDQIVSIFDKAPQVYLAESDNYRGTGDERLQIWKSLFTERVLPYNLSNDEDTRVVEVKNPIKEVRIDLSHLVFKPTVFVSTHVLRSYTKGSVLKNLFGLTPIVKKAQYHRNEIFNNLLTTLYQAIGGIDLAVLDASSYHHKFSGVRSPTDLLVVGRDAVVVETVGYALCGQKIEEIGTIQAFVEKGLGQGDMDSIQILGADFDQMRSRVKSAIKDAQRKEKSMPTAWSASRAVDALIKEGFFTPQHRTLQEVEKALIKMDARAVDSTKSIYGTLQRRVKMEKLRSEKHPDGIVYWKN